LKPRKVIGISAFALILLAYAFARFQAGLPEQDWHPLWRVALVLGLGVAFALAFYDHSDASLEGSGMNAKRGTLYFFITLVGLPALIGIHVIFGADYPLSRIALGTVALAALAGIVGTCTDKL
jgi:hypothetical protein